MLNESPSPVCHIAIPAPDLEQASSFYEKVFGWRVQRNTPGPAYWFFESGNVGGAFDANKTPATNATVLILKVENMDAAISRIVDAGGQMTQAPGNVQAGSSARDAYFTDPCGNAFGVYCES